MIKLFITPNHVCLLQKLEKTLMSLQILKMYSGGAYPFFFLSFVVLNSLAKQSKAWGSTDFIMYSKEGSFKTIF